MGALKEMYEFAKYCDKKSQFMPTKPRRFKMDFQWALTVLKAGGKVQRKGWNGKNMFVVLQKGYPDGIPINKNTAEVIGELEGTVHKFLPYLMFKTAQGDFVPWLISQTDALADDWQIYDPVSQYPNARPNPLE
jgi:hypothetical protein